MRLLLACSLALVVDLHARDVGACSSPFTEILEVDPVHMGETAAPAAPVVEASIYRAAEGGSPGCAEPTPQCGATASITLDVAATDDATAADRLGFGVELVGGDASRGLFIDARFIVSPELYLSFDRSDDSGFSIDLAVFAIDANGNAGPATLITVSEPGASGCASTGGTSSSLLLVGLTAFVLRRRRG
ncbi:MAG: hypothetical protein H0T79_09550 [Deltaproteobacteria bacterium]|nr:hypothetical protein [Deltaproteobacteria bacterium]